MSGFHLINWWAVELLIVVFGKAYEYIVTNWRVAPLSYILLVIGVIVGVIVLVKPIREIVMDSLLGILSKN